MTAVDVCNRIGAVLAQYTFRVTSEAQLADQVWSVLSAEDGMTLEREVVADPRSRFDILVHCDGWRVVLELKVGGATSLVERQAQRYALIESVDAVCVVTTSARLVHALYRPRDVGQILYTLGGKPFRAMALRTM